MNHFVLLQINVRCSTLDEKLCEVAELSHDNTAAVSGILFLQKSSVRECLAKETLVCFIARGSDRMMSHHTRAHTLLQRKVRTSQLYKFLRTFLLVYSRLYIQ